MRAFVPQAGVCSGIPVSLTAHTVTCTSEPYCFDLPGYAFSIVKYLQLSLGVFLTSKFFLPVVTRQGAVPLLPSSGSLSRIIPPGISGCPPAFSTAKGILSLSPSPASLLEKRLRVHCPNFGEADENEGGKDTGGTLRSAPIAQWKKKKKKNL